MVAPLPYVVMMEAAALWREIRIVTTLRYRRAELRASAATLQSWAPSAFDP
jgi:hypothetical protein